jgi:hypothetical protein
MGKVNHFCLPLASLSLHWIVVGCRVEDNNEIDLMDAENTNSLIDVTENKDPWREFVVRGMNSDSMNTSSFLDILVHITRFGEEFPNFVIS